jgi:phosphate transport system substrate-binding protein
MAALNNKKKVSRMKGYMILLVIVVMCLLGLVGWYILGSDQSIEEEDEDILEGLTTETYPTTDGSTSTHPLGVIVACKTLDVPYKWGWSLWEGTESILPNASTPEEESIAENISSKVTHHGTHDAYVNLIENKTDLILIARLPSDDELDLAESLDVELKTKAIALDAFVFILNKTNPVNDLSIQEIQKIYTGNITNWGEVGGTETIINPYQRNPNSGSQELMEKLVMRDLEMMDAPNLILMGMIGPINMLSWDEDGIGYSVYFYEEFMAPNEKIKLCAVNGILPNYESIRTRTYPYTTEVYAAIREDLDEDSQVNNLFKWLQSSEGQEVIKECGYVPIN